MTASFTGPLGESKASATAPQPRPPQPIRARRMVLSSAAWTQGMLTPASAEVAATALPRARNARRERTGQSFDARCTPEGRGAPLTPALSPSEGERGNRRQLSDKPTLIG